MKSYSNLRFLAFWALFIFTGVLFVLAAFNSKFPGDQGALLRFQALGSGWLERAASDVTHLGDAVVAIPSILLLPTALWLWHKRVDSLLCLLIVAPEALGQGLKALIGRPRPPFSLAGASFEGYSFPSGHVLHVMLFFGLLMYLVAQYVRTSYLRWILWSLLALAVLMVGASRVYLGVHWPSDVVGSYFFGGLSLWTLIWLKNWAFPPPIKRVVS